MDEKVPLAENMSLLRIANFPKEMGDYSKLELLQSSNLVRFFKRSTNPKPLVITQLKNLGWEDENNFIS